MLDEVYSLLFSIYFRVDEVGVSSEELSLGCVCFSSELTEYSLLLIIPPSSAKFIQELSSTVHPFRSGERFYSLIYVPRPGRYSHPHAPSGSGTRTGSDYFYDRCYNLSFAASERYGASSEAQRLRSLYTHSRSASFV